MKIKSNTTEITVSSVMGDSIRANSKTYPALRVSFSGAVSEDEIAALCSGHLEIIDDSGNIVGVHDGYTTRREHSLVIGKIQTAEQERDELEAALAAEEAKKPYIEKLTAELDDATASTVIPLYPTMQYNGALIQSGTRINWNGTLKRAAVDLWDRLDSNPDNAPDMWEDVLYRDGYRIIPEKITVGLAFSNGERGWWGDVLYESTVNGNVYTPEEYADNWKIAEV